MRAIIPIPAFQDNYIWLVHDGQDALVVDPGDAAPVQAVLDRSALRLRAVLLTHHHDDHVGGAAELALRHGATVYGPARTACSPDFVALHGGEQLAFDQPALSLEVIAVPGHTRDHLAYHGDGLLFCGDTLFAAGCGRLFEGSAATMYDSLQRLAALAPNTQVYCAHEYTLSNLRFARQVEPANPNRIERERNEEDKRQRGEPTLPSTLALERATNPFLRCRDPAVVAAASRAAGAPLASPAAVFAALRTWKDGFRG